MALFEQDFIMRQIQYLTQILQQIIFKKNQNKHQEAVDEIQDALQEITKDDPKEFNELSLQNTLDIFLTEDKFQSELALAVADLLVEEGEMLQDKSFDRSQKSNQQALLLYKKAKQDNNAAVPLDIQQKIQQLEQKLSPSDNLDEVNLVLD